MADLLDLDVLDEDEPFEIDHQAAHLFKHAALGIDDIYETWRSDPLFYPAKPPADWLMVAEVRGSRADCSAGQTESPRPTPLPAHRLLRGVQAAGRPVSEGPERVMSRRMTPQEEYDFYANPENQIPQGPGRRRKATLTKLVPVRLAEDTLAEIRRRAEADDRSVSAWIRRAVEHELHRPAS